MGRACSAHGGGEEFIKDFGGKARRKETNTIIQTFLRQLSN
jgi:hypothetical protein